MSGGVMWMGSETNMHACWAEVDSLKVQMYLHLCRKVTILFTRPETRREGINLGPTHKV